MKAYVYPWRGHPTWNTPPLDCSCEDFIAIYPEIVPENPLRCKNVVRWILYKTPHKYPESDVIVPYLPAYDTFDIGSHLYLPPVDTEVFFDAGLPRSGKMHYIGSKGGCTRKVFEVDRWPELNRCYAINQADYARRLQTCELLYCYDNMSSVCECARLCGCPCVIIPNGTFPKSSYEEHELGMGGLGWGMEEEQIAIATMDSADFMRRYKAMQAEFRHKLSEFIQFTQSRFA
jgi:hypothetical protein